MQNITIKKAYTSTGTMHQVCRDGRPIPGQEFISEAMADEAAIKEQYAGVRPSRQEIEEFLERIKKDR